MSAIQFIRDYLKDQHNGYRETIDNLSAQQVNWHPGGQANSIAFLLWHYTRTEDNIIQFVLQRKPPIWIEGGWDRKFGLDSKAQGTGMSHEDAANIRLDPWPDFRQYLDQVFQATEIYISAVPDKDLSKELTVRPLGQVTLRHLLGYTLLGHGYCHLGEVWAVKGLLGLQGASF